MRAAVLLGLALVLFSCRSSGPSGRPAAAPEVPLRVRLVPDTARYRIASHLRVEQRVGSQPQVSNLSLVYLLRVRLASADSAGTLKAEIVIDSVATYEGSAVESRTAATAARGARFTATVLPTGELQSLDGPDSTDPLLNEIRRDVQQFFPRLPPAGLTAGESWVDTTEQKVASGGVPLSLHSVAEHRAGAPADRDGQRVLPVVTLTNYTFSGKGRQGGQEFVVEGSGRRYTSEFVSLEGRYLGLVAADTSDFAITLRAAGLTIPGRQFRADTVNVVP